METAKLMFLSLLLCVQGLYAQGMPGSRKGLIRAQANLAGGYRFPQKNFAAYLAGDLDVYLSERVSVGGEVWYSLPLNDGPLRQNHAVFAGFSYHPLRQGAWDPFIGFSPGLALCKIVYEDASGRHSTPLSPAPLLGITGGCNWYLGSIFHLFVRLRWAQGQLMGDAPFRTPLQELKISGGLGWNIRSKKAYSY